MITALIDGDTLFCKACNSKKPLADFHKDSSSKRGHAYYCKVCANYKSRKWTQDHGQQDDYRVSKWNSYYKHKYGMTLEERSKMLEDQHNRCLICSVVLGVSGTHTHTDHCHTTGKVRGILCTNCNRGLGHFQDSIFNLEKAILYLKGSSC